MNRSEAHQYFLSLGWDHTPCSNEIFEFWCGAGEAAKGGAVLDAGSGHQRCKPFFEGSIYVAQEHPASGAEAKGITEYDILCDLKEIPLVSNCLRVVFSSVSLEHMRYPTPFFEEAFRVLEPGGLLFIHVPFVYMEHEQPYDFQRPTSFGLRRWYDDAGFVDCEIKPTSSSINTAMWISQLALTEEADRETLSRWYAARKRIEFRLFQRACAYMKRRYDRGPFEGVQFPISWQAVAKKPGQLAERKDDLEPTLEFLRRNKLPEAQLKGSTLTAA